MTMKGFVMFVRILLLIWMRTIILCRANSNTKNIWKSVYLLTIYLKGHCRLRKSLMRMGLSETDDCRFCEEKTPIHLAANVPCHCNLEKQKVSEIRHLIQCFQSTYIVEKV